MKCFAISLLLVIASCSSESHIEDNQKILFGQNCKKWFSAESGQICEFCKNGEYSTYVRNEQGIEKQEPYDIIGFQEFWELDEDSLYIKYPKNTISWSVKIIHISTNEICFEPKNERYGKQICYSPY